MFLNFLKKDKPQEPIIDKKEEERRIREENDKLIGEKCKELQEIIDSRLPFEKTFKIGDVVKYTKIPNDFKMGVIQFHPLRIRVYPYWGYAKPEHYFIDESRMVVEYFDNNGNIRQINEETKWFESV
ncbi:MAG TPA: hypothetical protein PLH46_04990 [Caldisericia bacterium]|nr:hypothetical protein [Caldisericia bacterium]